MAPLMVGAFYNPHLGAELARAQGIDHLAMADPPAPTDPHWPAIKARYTLLLHDYLGQLSEPLDERSIARARALAELYRTPWVAEHFQCLHTEDGRYNINYVFPRCTPTNSCAASSPTRRRCRRGSTNRS